MRDRASEFDLHVARRDLAGLEEYLYTGHPWRMTCGGTRDDHSWCRAQLERARQRVRDLERAADEAAGL